MTLTKLPPENYSSNENDLPLRKQTEYVYDIVERSIMIIDNNEKRQSTKMMPVVAEKWVAMVIDAWVEMSQNYVFGCGRNTLNNK